MVSLIITEAINGFELAVSDAEPDKTRVFVFERLEDLLTAVSDLLRREKKEEL